MLGLVVSTLGELLGYASGAGDAKQKLQKLSTFEFHRIRHLANQARQAGSR